MKKVLYYVSNFELVDFDGFSESTGNKEVRVYEVNDETKRLEPLFTLDLTIVDNSEEEIIDYLNDNGYGDEIFELVEL